MKFVHNAITKSATIRYAVEMCMSTPALCAGYQDKARIDNICKAGCPNYSSKWSCPPYAPLFTDLASKWDKLYIVFMHVELSQFSYVNNDYLKGRAAKSMLKARADRFVRKMADLHGSCISTGSCRLCKQCNCKIDMPCAHPELMAYSFEALGINVGQMVEDIFQRPFIWDRQHFLPQYTAVVCGILTNESLSDDYLQTGYKKMITH